MLVDIIREKPPNGLRFFVGDHVDRASGKTENFWSTEIDFESIEWMAFDFSNATHS